MLTHVQLSERARLAAMARVVEASALAGFDTITREVLAADLFPPTGPPTEFGTPSFDLVEELDDRRRTLARTLRDLVALIACWEQQPADDGVDATTP